MNEWLDRIETRRDLEKPFCYLCCKNWWFKKTYGIDLNGVEDKET